MMSQPQQPPAQLPDPGNWWDVPIVWPDGWQLDPRHPPLPSTEAQRRCCGLRVIKGGPDDAATTCCDGKLIICIFKPGEVQYPKPHGASPGEIQARSYAWFFIDECMVEHERRHAHTSMYDCTGRSDGDPPPGFKNEYSWMLSNCEHCLIYQAEIACLEARKAQCKKLIASYTCEIVIDQNIDKLKD
jgi:hypothetical protein